MLYVVSYDITDDGRRRRVLEVLKDFGRRVQFSVFECGLDEEGLEELCRRLAVEIEAEEDSCRIYRVCAGCADEVRILGRGERYEQRGYVIV